MRRATVQAVHAAIIEQFQSTLSMRRATGSYVITVPFRHISIHALHEESDDGVIQARWDIAISIHALHEESDRAARSNVRSPRRFQSTLSMRRATVASGFTRRDTIFQSTLSMRRATGYVSRDTFGMFDISIHALHEESDSECGQCETCHDISIHALHEESDKTHHRPRLPRWNFNPRSP